MSTHRVRFSWCYTAEDKGTDKVLLLGTFSKWTPLEMEKRADYWVLDVDLGSGIYYYKFKVNDKWCYDITKSHCDDGYGGRNNYCVVRCESKLEEVEVKNCEEGQGEFETEADTEVTLEDGSDQEEEEEQCESEHVIQIGGLVKLSRPLDSFGQICPTPECMRLGSFSTYEKPKETSFIPIKPHITIIGHFQCPSCSTEITTIINENITYPKGLKISLTVSKPSDLQLTVQTSPFSEIEIPEIGVSIYPKREGEISTVEKILQKTLLEISTNNLDIFNNSNEKTISINNCVNELKEAMSLKKPFTFTLTDIAGDSMIELPGNPNFNYLSKSEDYFKQVGNTTISWFERTYSQHNRLSSLKSYTEVPYFQSFIEEDPFHDISMEVIANHISTGKIKNIIVLTGAGISTNSGIPDYRGGKGIYRNPQVIEMMGETRLSPDELFSLKCFLEAPKLFFTANKDFSLPIVRRKHKPTLCHKFIGKLNEKGILLRNYTQNIDGFETQVGVPTDKLIHAHGALESEAICLKCGNKCDSDSFWNIIENDEIPTCTCGAHFKPGTILFGEQLPDTFGKHLVSDFKTCDLLIVMGTSLCVYPFADLVSMVSKSTPRLLINSELVGPFVGCKVENVDMTKINKKEKEKKKKVQYINKNDLAYVGDIDDGVTYLLNYLNWLL